MTAAPEAPPPARRPPPHPRRGHQGFVVVGSTVAALLVVIAVSATSLHWTTSSHHGTAGGATTTSTRHGSKAGSPQSAPGSTALIQGATTLFVTTTVPLTTTSSTSTTSTLPAAGALIVVGGPVTLSPDHRTVVLQLGNPGKRSVTWVASTSLSLISVAPDTGRLRGGAVQSVAVTLENAPSTTTVGSIRFTPSSGRSTTVPVTVRAPASTPFAVSPPSLSPATPDCAGPVQVSVVVTGGEAVSVQLSSQQSSGLGTLDLAPQGGGVWTVLIPAQPGGTHVAGAIAARTSTGLVARTSLRYTVGSRPGVC